MTRPALYCRVSSQEQVEGYSLDAQERAAAQFCAARGWPAPVVYSDAGRSAFSDATADRPAFAAMLDAAEAGEHDVVIVHKLDRFARSLTTTLRELQRLERAGVTFEAQDHVVSGSLTLQIPIATEGLYRFSIMAEERVLAVVPFRVMYQDYQPAIG